MSRKLFLIILIPAALLIGGYLYLRLSLQSAISKEEKKTGTAVKSVDTLGGQKVSAADLRPLFIQRLQQLLTRSSGGLYTLAVADLKVDVLTSVITLQGVRVKTDSAVLASLKKGGGLPPDVFTGSFDSLRIEGVNLDDAVTGKTMNYDLIKLIKPVLTIHHTKDAAEKEPGGKEDFAQRFLKEMEKLTIKQLIVEDGTLTLHNDARRGAPAVIKHLQVVLNNVLLDSATRKDKNRFFFAADATVSFSNYHRPTPDGLYSMKIDNVKIRAPENNVTLTGFSFTSPFGKKEFAAKQKQSKELYNVRFPSVSLSNVNWWALLNEEAITADEAVAEGGKLDIFLDRSLPPKNKTGNFPAQLLMKLPVKLNIAKASIRNLDFSYGEYNPISQEAGTVYVNKVALTLANLNNERRPKPKPVLVSGSALFMRSVPVEAQFSFDMAAYKTGAFTAHIKVDGFDGTLLNSFTVPMGLMKMEKGHLQSAEATLQGNERKASGTVFIPYTDLKLTLLEKDKDKKALDKKDVTTFLANLLVIKNNNPATGKDARKEQAEFTRIPEGGFFMLVWKTILVGALKTIGAPTKIAYKTVANTKKKG